MFQTKSCGVTQGIYIFGVGFSCWQWRHWCVWTFVLKVSAVREANRISFNQGLLYWPAVALLVAVYDHDGSIVINKLLHLLIFSYSSVVLVPISGRSVMVANPAVVQIIHKRMSSPGRCRNRVINTNLIPYLGNTSPHCLLTKTFLAYAKGR